jgi:hypothetical protein
LKKKYIHRLHVLNPLTNTDIIGHVQYFKVQSNALKRKEVIASPLSKGSIEILDCVSPSVAQIEKGELGRWTAGHNIVSEDSVMDGQINEFVGKVLDKEKCIDLPASSMFRPKKTARSLSWNITIKIPDSNLVDNPTRLDVSPGQVTRFAEVVPIEQVSSLIPKTQKHQKRLLSYRNAISASGVPASFHEWARALTEDREGSDYDLVDFSQLARSDHIPSAATVESETWDAVLFATDDDYLSSSVVRRIFLENAINPEDSKLFEMKEYTGEEPPRRDMYLPEQPMCSLM